jgi:hypothetical protein
MTKLEETVRLRVQEATNLGIVDKIEFYRQHYRLHITCTSSACASIITRRDSGARKSRKVKAALEVSTLVA